jgi:hypothetical protein
MMCGEKIRHATRDEALEHIKRLVYHNHVAGEDHRSAGLATYPCDECGAWHVGHRESSPMVWHYTTMSYLDAILASDELRPSKPRKLGRDMIRSLRQEHRAVLLQLNEPEPLLWFSRNEEWEYSVDKIHVTTAGRAQTEVRSGGLLRFGVPASFAKLRWSDYLARNPLTRRLRNAMAARGNPVEWLATDEPVPLKYVRQIQVYMRSWLPVDQVDDETFERYIAGREAEYDVAWESMKRKVTAAKKALREDQTLEKDGVPVCFNEAEYILYNDSKQRQMTEDIENPSFLREAIAVMKE